VNNDVVQAYLALTRLRLQLLFPPRADDSDKCQGCNSPLCPDCNPGKW